MIAFSMEYKEYTKEDFIYDTPPRIMGSETEYTTQSYYSPEIPISDAPILLHSSTGMWLANGARLYRDMGSVTEYATPECRNAYEVALYERAGEATVYGMADQFMNIETATKVHKRTGYDTVIVNDKVLLEPMSTGHHENYLTPNVHNYRILQSYLVTRGVWAGAGLVSGTGYQTTQKADGILFNSGHGTEHGLKKTEHYHPGEDRMELRLGDGNMSEWQIVQKFAMSSLALRLSEHEHFPEELIIGKKLTAQASRASRFGNITTAGGEMLTPAQHQKRIAQVALDYFGHYPNIPREELTAAEEVIKACEAIDRIGKDYDNLDLVSDRIDWAAKLANILKKGIAPPEINTRNIHAVALDLAWDDISPHGVARHWYRRYGNERLAPSEITRAKATPPATRALARAALLRQHGADIEYIDWHTATIVDTPTAFMSYDPSSTRPYERRRYNGEKINTPSGQLAYRDNNGVGYYGD